MANLADAFRRLRAAWFDDKLASRSHERDWEDDVKEARRLEGNAELLERYTEQTECLIAGDQTVPIAPRCPADMDER